MCVAAGYGRYACSKSKNIDAGYDFLQVLWDVSLKVDEGEFVALVGPNGAGKTTTLRTVAGLLKPTQGGVFFNGQAISGLKAHEISRLGIAYVSEGLNLFTNMSVYENLLLGAYAVHDKKQRDDSLAYVFDLFPRMQERSKQLAGLMSGGERKMLAIGRGIMSNPKVLLVDEPSLGLAPYLAHEVFHALRALERAGRHDLARRAKRPHDPGNHPSGIRAGAGPGGARRPEPRVEAERSTCARPIWASEAVGVYECGRC